MTNYKFDGDWDDLIRVVSPEEYESLRWKRFNPIHGVKPAGYYQEKINELFTLRTQRQTQQRRSQCTVWIYTREMYLKIDEKVMRYYYERCK